jgi:hypothetical protein
MYLKQPNDVASAQRPSLWINKNNIDNGWYLLRIYLFLKIIMWSKKYITYKYLLDHNYMQISLNQTLKPDEPVITPDL